MLDSAHQLTPYDSAPDGHVTLTAELSGEARGRQGANLALGFGTTQARRFRSHTHRCASSSSRASRRSTSGSGCAMTHDLKRPARGSAHRAIHEYYESVNVVRASVDKTFPGAIAAGLASPWGQSVPAGNLTNSEPTYFGSYREVFARDLYEAFTGLLVAGDVQTAQAATRFLFERQQQADGSMPRNSLLNGQPAPDTGGLQLDETSYPILMDWQSGLAHDRDLYTQHVIPAADFLVAHGPSDGVERWEEQSGYSPSTIAAEIAGLTAAAHIATDNNDPVRAAIYQATADDFARNIKAWTVTTNGPFISPTVPSYFIRIAQDRRSRTPADQINLGNGSITRRPAVADRRGLPRAGAPRRPARERLHGSVIADRRRRHNRTPDAERDRLLSLWDQPDGIGRRLRRLLPAERLKLHDHRCAVAADGHRHRAPVARALWRARRVRRRRRPDELGARRF